MNYWNTQTRFELCAKFVGCAGDSWMHEVAGEKSSDTSQQKKLNYSKKIKKVRIQYCRNCSCVSCRIVSGRFLERGPRVACEKVKSEKFPSRKIYTEEREKNVNDGWCRDPTAASVDIEKVILGPGWCGLLSGNPNRGEIAKPANFPPTHLRLPSRNILSVDWRCDPHYAGLVARRRKNHFQTSPQFFAQPNFRPTPRSRKRSCRRRWSRLLSIHGPDPRPSVPFSATCSVRGETSSFFRDRREKSMDKSWVNEIQQSPRAACECHKEAGKSDTRRQRRFLLFFFSL